MNVLDEIALTLERIEKRLDAMEKKEHEAYISAKEVAEILGCKIGEIYRKVKAGRLPHYRIGGLIKFKKSEII